MPARKIVAAAVAAAAAITAAAIAAAPAASASQTGPPYLSHFHRLKTIASTVPANGDLNPYGVWIVRDSIGRLHRGNILVSNFNNAQGHRATDYPDLLLPFGAAGSRQHDDDRLGLPAAK